ncbi:MAG TPA: hypothetical protein VHU83_05000 [Bryobacteraceae bacterium]|jgi:hypothetical protein|nr:hypothetical protein [Bryobacteraceae bacterium]
MAFLRNSYNELAKPQNSFLTFIAGGVLGLVASLIASIVYSKVQKDVWKRDVTELSDKLSALRVDVENLVGHTKPLLNQLATALRGPFPKSLFRFHPVTSDKIAEILTDEALRHYTRHYNRVLVSQAKDRYVVQGLEHFDLDGCSMPVWHLAFRVWWEWRNDSKVARNPIEDFVLVACANPEAIENWPVEPESRMDLELDLRNFFRRRGNYVRSIIAHPAEPDRPIGEDLFPQIFSIENSIVVRRGNEKSERLDGRRMNKDELPKMLYSGYSFEATDKTSLEPFQTLTVEYRGTMRIAADPLSGNGDHYLGNISFPPSDIIANHYSLQLDYPGSVTFDGKAFDIRIETERSGWRYLHDPIKAGARPSQEKHRNVATISPDMPLTDLHELSLTWSATPRAERH